MISGNRQNRPVMDILFRIQQFDHRTFGWCMRRKHQRLLVEFSKKISHTADGHLYGLISALLLIEGSAESFALLKTFALAFSFERVCYYVLKNFFKRNRPPEAIPDFSAFITPGDKFSFPSGHTSCAFMMATLLGMEFPELSMAFYCWAGLVGSSRVLLGVHFPTDVAIGALLGHTISLFAINTVPLFTTIGQ